MEGFVKYLRDARNQPLYHEKRLVNLILYADISTSFNIDAPPPSRYLQALRPLPLRTGTDHAREQGAPFVPYLV